MYQYNVHSRNNPQWYWILFLMHWTAFQSIVRLKIENFVCVRDFKWFRMIMDLIFQCILLVAVAAAAVVVVAAAAVLFMFSFLFKLWNFL